MVTGPSIHVMVVVLGSVLVQSSALAQPDDSALTLAWDAPASCPTREAAIAFGVEQMSLDQYIDWVVENARRFEEVELKAEGATTEERAKALVEEMVGKGLATR